MDYDEFCLQLKPLIIEICDNCKEMTEMEYKEYYKEFMEEIHRKYDKSIGRCIHKIMNAVETDLYK